MRRWGSVLLLLSGWLLFPLISLAGEVATPGAPVPRQALAISWYNILVSIIYGLVGILLLLIGYYIYELITPFSVKKELLEDQNIALGVVVAAFILGMAVIIASAIL